MIWGNKAHFGRDKTQFNYYKSGLNGMIQTHVFFFQKLY